MKRWQCAIFLLAGASFSTASLPQVSPGATLALPAIKSVADIPRFAYPLNGRVDRFLDNGAELAPLVARMKGDIEKTVLARYDIRDPATLAQFQSILRDIAVFQDDRQGFENANRLYREYLDKPALKMWTGTVEEHCTGPPELTSRSRPLVLFLPTGISSPLIRQTNLAQTQQQQACHQEDRP